MSSITWCTDNHIDGGVVYPGILVSWAEVERVLGRPHDSSSHDDERLLWEMLAAGAPAWIAEGARSWIDDCGWRVIRRYGPGERLTG